MPHVWDPLADEINQIENQHIRCFVKKGLEAAPAYFWTVPASSSGKYHPAESRKPGGLVHHTKLVVYFVKALMVTMECEQWRDELIAAAILHDAYKNGDGNTRYGSNWSAHGVNLRELFAHQEWWGRISQDAFVGKIMDLISRHMGKWGGSAPRPATMEDWCLQLSDYVASRKLVNITQFDEEKAP